LLAVELEVGMQWDTYAEEKQYGTPGFSLYLGEDISDKFTMLADIKNLYGLNYDAYAGGRFNGKYFQMMMSFLFAIRNNKILPGFALDANLDFGKIFSLQAAADFAFSPSDFSDNSLMDIEGALVFHNKNSDVKLIYEYYQLFQSSGYDYTHSGKMDILAFEKDFPFKIGVFFGAGAESRTYDATYFDLIADVGGQMIFDFEKAGCYTLKGEAQVFRFTRTAEEKIPFAISLAAKFNFN
ncbi:MAG: hypothetical protein K5839_07025, partial [Treponemataceae bacterium]|nr:hypothetical protein [Treponemataceae bacterium]